MVGNRRPLAAVTTFRDDGHRLATTGPNGDLKVWDTTEPRQPGLLVRIRRRHRIVAAAWNPVAADLLATLSTDGSISILGLAERRPPRELVVLHLPYGKSGALAWLSDGRHLACASGDGVICVWNVAAGSRYTQVVGDRSACLSMFAEPDNVLRAVYQDGSIRRISPLMQRAPGRTQHVDPIVAAAWSANGTLMVAARGDGSVEVLDEALRVWWSRAMTGAGSSLFAWHGDSLIVVADRAAQTLAAVDASGRMIWRTEISPAPTSLSTADGVVAVGSSGFAPRIVELESGDEL